MVGTRYEEYLEAIHSVVQRKGYAKVSDVATVLDVSQAATTQMLKRLSTDGFVNYEPNSGMTLTEKGTKVAEALSQRHEVLREFLEILGMDPDTADDEACKIEHVARPETMELLTSFVDFMSTRDSPKWLETFKKYCRDGVLDPCPGTCQEDDERGDSHD
jgi:DtxR family Mn-dependent transcriptional regulator